MKIIKKYNCVTRGQWEVEIRDDDDDAYHLELVIIENEPTHSL